MMCRMRVSAFCFAYPLVCSLYYNGFSIPKLFLPSYYYLSIYHRRLRRKWPAVSHNIVSPLRYQYKMPPQIMISSLYLYSVCFTKNYIVPILTHLLYHTQLKRTRPQIITWAHSRQNLPSWGMSCWLKAVVEEEGVSLHVHRIMCSVFCSVRRISLYMGIFYLMLYLPMVELNSTYLHEHEQHKPNL